MYVSVYWYQVKAGKENAAIAHHRAWEREQSFSAEGFLCSELLVNPEDSSEFLWLVRFENDEAAWTLNQSARVSAWYAQLVRLADVGPVVLQFQSVLPTLNGI